MQIIGPYRISTPQSVEGGNRIGDAKLANPAGKPRAASPVDQLDLSASVQKASGVSDPSAIAGGGEIRLERVAAIRRAIADGTYETPHRLESAVNRLFDDLA